MSEIRDEGDDRLAAWRFRSVCGIEALDRLAAADPDELAGFLRDVAANGWIVRATTKLPASTPAYFLPVKGRFYYDPERMTRLDMAHERIHLEAFVRRGHWQRGQGGVYYLEDEIAAYSHELDLLVSIPGVAVGYIYYLEGRIEQHRDWRSKLD